MQTLIFKDSIQHVVPLFLASDGVTPATTMAAAMRTQPISACTFWSLAGIVDHAAERILGRHLDQRHRLHDTRYEQLPSADGRLAKREFRGC